MWRARAGHAASPRATPVPARRCGSTVPVTGEVIAQNRRPPLEGAGKKGVIVERWGQLRNLLAEAALASQRPVGQTLEAGEAGASVGFCKQDIKAHHRRLLAFKQLVCQSRQLVPSPGPVADPFQAFFIDVDDDDALIRRARHGRAQPGVVDDVFKPLQHLQMQDA